MSKTPYWPMLLLDPETLGFSNSVCVFCWFSSETSWVEQCFWCLESDVGRCWKAAGAWRSAEFTQIAIRQNGGGQSARSVAWTKTFPSANPPRSHQSILLHELTSQLTQSGFRRDRPKKTQHNATGFPQDGRCFESISKHDSSNCCRWVGWSSVGGHLRKPQKLEHVGHESYTPKD